MSDGKVKLGSIASDVSKEDGGEWQDVAEWPGVRLKVRSINYKPYANARDEGQRRLAKRLGRTPYSAEMQPLVARLAEKFLLLEWDGFDVPYSKEEAEVRMNDRAYSGTLVAQVIFASTRVGEREVEFETAAAKNSAAPSATS